MAGPSVAGRPFLYADNGWIEQLQVCAACLKAPSPTPPQRWQGLGARSDRLPHISASALVETVRQKPKRFDGLSPSPLWGGVWGGDLLNATPTHHPPKKAKRTTNRAATICVAGWMTLHLPVQTLRTT